MAIRLDTFADELCNVILGYADDFPKKAEKGVHRAMEYLKPQIEARSPRQQSGGGVFAGSWKMVDKFDRNHVKITYLHNTDKTGSFNERKYETGQKSRGRKGIQIPMTNIIEGKKNAPWKGARPFIRQTVRENELKVLEILTDELMK